MNKTILISLAYLFLCLRGSAQEFYPLHVGNLWEYWELPSYYGFTTRAITDTLMPNSFAYTLLRSDNVLRDLYLRQDGPRVYEYFSFAQSDELLFDFTKTTGDTVYVRYVQNDTLIMTVVYDRIENVFSRMLRQLGFWEQSSQSSFYILYEVTDSMGLTSVTFEPGVHFGLMGAIIDSVQYGTITGVMPTDSLIPPKYSLHQNYPNPFNPSTKIGYALPVDVNVILKVYNTLGQEVAILVQSEQKAGWYEASLNATTFSSGIYIYRLQAGEFIETKKMLLLK